MKVEVWYCAECNRSGALPYVAHEGPASVEGRVVEAHRNRSPECENVVTMIQILTDAGNDIEALGQIMK